MTQAESVLPDLLTFCTARSLSVVTGTARTKADHSDVSEATGFHAAKAIGGMKKAGAATCSAAKPENTRWLPSPLKRLGAAAADAE